MEGVQWMDLGVSESGRPPPPLSLFQVSYGVLYSSMLPVLWDDGRKGSVWGESVVRSDCSVGGPGPGGGASVEASDESASPRRSSPHSAPNFFVHFDAHDTHVSARGREAWRLSTVSSKIAPIVRAAAALADTASAGYGIAQRRRYVSQHASVESAAL